MTSKNVGKNIAEYEHGPTFKKMVAKYGKQHAQKIAIAAAYSAARNAGGKFHDGGKTPTTVGTIHMTDEKGNRIGAMKGGERIFSLESTEQMENLADAKKHMELGKLVAAEIEKHNMAKEIMEPNESKTK